MDSTFDANDRLLQESRDDRSNGVGVDEVTSYGYDHTQQTEKSVTATGASFAKTRTLFTYNLQGRMATSTVETRDANGVLTRVERSTYAYDHMGIRVSDLREVDNDANGTWDSRTEVEYLNADLNHTGHSQVIRETHRDVATNAVTQTVDYTLGHDELLQTTTTYDAQGAVTGTGTAVFGHDGHGSVRVLTDLTGVLVQAYTYDAYGQFTGFFNDQGTLVSGGNGQFAESGQALTTLLYSGERTDSLTGLQYLRARYYDPSNGRFNRLDPFFGNPADPQSFHKYAYAHSDPVTYVDPSGQFIGMIILAALRSAHTQAEGAKASSALGTTNSLVRMINAYQKVAQFLDRAEEVVQLAQTIVDLLSFDPGE